MCWLPARREKLKGWRACVELSQEQICVCCNLALSSHFSLMGLCNCQVFTTITFLNILWAVIMPESCANQYNNICYATLAITSEFA